MVGEQGGKKRILGTKLIRVPIVLIEQVERYYPSDDAVGQKLYRWYLSQNRLHDFAEMIAGKCGMDPGHTVDEVMIQYVATAEVRIQQLEEEVKRYRTMFEGLLLFFNEAGMTEIVNAIEKERGEKP